MQTQFGTELLRVVLSCREKKSIQGVDFKEPCKKEREAGGLEGRFQSSEPRQLKTQSPIIQELKWGLLKNWEANILEDEMTPQG